MSETPSKRNILPILLIFGPIMMIMLIGGIYNATAFTPNTQIYIGTNGQYTSCQYANGTQVPMSECQSINAGKFFLNPSSPFTYLMRGDLFGFFTSWFSAPQSKLFSTLNSVQNFNASSWVGGSSCNSNRADSTEWECELSNSTLVSGPMIFQIAEPNTVSQSACSYLNNAGYCNNVQVFSCYMSFGFSGNATANIANVWQFGNYAYVANPSGTSSGGTAVVCSVPNNVLGNITSGQFQANVTAINSYSPTVQSALSQSNNGLFSIWIDVISLFVGVILLFLSLGIQLSGGALTLNFGISSNEFGSKQAAVYGLIFIFFSFWYSEFGAIVQNSLNTWSGLGTIVVSVITMIYFGGAFWQSQSFF